MLDSVQSKSVKKWRFNICLCVCVCVHARICGKRYGTIDLTVNMPHSMVCQYLLGGLLRRRVLSINQAPRMTKVVTCFFPERVVSCQCIFWFGYSVNGHACVHQQKTDTQISINRCEYTCIHMHTAYTPACIQAHTHWHTYLLHTHPLPVRSLACCRWSGLRSLLMFPDDFWW